MGPARLCCTPNNNSNIKPYVRGQAAALASAATELPCNMTLDHSNIPEFLLSASRSDETSLFFRMDR